MYIQGKKLAFVLGIERLQAQYFRRDHEDIECSCEVETCQAEVTELSKTCKGDLKQMVYRNMLEMKLISCWKIDDFKVSITSPFQTLERKTLLCFLSGLQAAGLGIPFGTQTERMLETNQFFLFNPVTLQGVPAFKDPEGLLTGFDYDFGLFLIISSIFTQVHYPSNAMEIADDPDSYFISSTQLESLHSIVHIVGKHLSGAILQDCCFTLFQPAHFCW